MPIVAAAAVPSGSNIGRLHDDVERTFSELPPFDVVLLLAGGAEPLLHDVAAAEAELSDGSLRRVDVVVDTDLLLAIARRGQAPRVQSRALGGSLAALALRVHGHDPSARIVPMSLPSRATAQSLDGIAVGIAAAAATLDSATVVIATGDLAEAGPTDQAAVAPRVAGPADAAARGWDEQAAAALAASSLPPLRALGPDAASTVGADGWAPLTVLLGVLDATGMRIGHSTYQLADGVGRVVARAEPTNGAGRR